MYINPMEMSLLPVTNFDTLNIKQLSSQWNSKNTKYKFIRELKKSFPVQCCITTKIISGFPVLIGCQITPDKGILQNEQI